MTGQTEQTKDYSLLRPFNLDEAQAGALLCDAFGSTTYKFLAANTRTWDNVAVQLLTNGVGDFLYVNDKEHLRMKPLAWLEGKPVYKGDIVWNKHGDLSSILVESAADGWLIGTDPAENYPHPSESELKCLTWTQQKIQQEKLPEVLHDPKKFKVGDKVKVVRTLPEGVYYADLGWKNSWVDSMSDYVGNEYVIEYASAGNGYQLEDFSFPSCALELVEEAKVATEVKLYAYLFNGTLLYNSNNNLHKDYHPDIYKRIPSEDKVVIVED